jgi:hypothetical protein
MNLADLAAFQPPPHDSGLAWGTVGWEEDDDSSYYERGSSDDDGNTLVRVQLYRGRDMTRTLDQTRAQGQRILCQLGGGLFHIPSRGTRVLVGVPEPHGHVPGAATILSIADPAGPNQFGNMKPDEFCIGPPGSKARLIIKKNGTIVLFTETGDGKSVAFSLGPDGFQIMHPSGSLTVDSNGITLTSGTSALVLDAQGNAKVIGQIATLEGSFIGGVAGQVLTLLGKGPFAVPPVSSAAYGIAGPVNLVSTNVLVSP